MFPVMICKGLRSKSVVVDAFLAIITWIFRDSKVINDIRLFILLSQSPDMASHILLLNLILRQTFFLIELAFCRFSDDN